MRDVFYLISGQDIDSKKSLDVDIDFFEKAGVGDFIKVKDDVFEIERRIFDPTDMDIILEVNPVSINIGKHGKYINLLKQGMKLQAVKEYKEDYNVGLKDAKEAIDELIDRYNLKSDWNY